MGVINRPYRLISCTCLLWLFALSAVFSQTIQTMMVRTDIRFRYAITEVTCVMSNDHNTARELQFEVTLPKDAYISNFTMEIEGKEYPGHVKEKAAAREQYDTALQSGYSGGLVEQSVRHSNKFDVSVNIAAGSNVTFRLMYEELLRRRFGVYEHAVYINPKAANILSYTLEVFIQDKNEIIKLRTPEMRSDIISNAVEERDNPLTVISYPSPSTAHILYRPSPEDLQQKGEGWFVVQYDVNATHAGGELLVVDGYFVHFFVPDDDLPPLPLDIVFVLDISGSMMGTKIRQLRDAMQVILGDLTENDRFNILLFDDRIESWRDQLQMVNSDNIRSAKTYVGKIAARGMTDINEALLRGLTSLRDSGFQSGRVPMLFFLTDGQPTSGMTHLDGILNSVKSRNEGVVSIYSLAFGTGADYQFLQKLSAQNKGFARKIYEASDAAAQVTGLYSEISSVVLSNLTVTYHAISSSKDDGKDVVKSYVIPEDVTRTSQPTVFRKFDFIATGRIPRKYPTTDLSVQTAGSDLNSTQSAEFGLKFIVSGQSAKGQVNLVLTESDLDALTLKGDNPFWTVPRDLGQMTERVWAFLTIKQLLEQRLVSKDAGGLEARILQLSIKYNFVTPLTSMVVTRPQDVSSTEGARASFVADGDVSSHEPAHGHHRLSPAMTLRGMSAHILHLKYRWPLPARSVPIPARSVPIPARSVPIPARSVPIPAHSMPIPAHSMPIPVHAGDQGLSTRPGRSRKGRRKVKYSKKRVHDTRYQRKTFTPPGTRRPTFPPQQQPAVSVAKPMCARNQGVKLKYISGTLQTNSQARSVCLELPETRKLQGGNYTIFTTDRADPSNSRKQKACSSKSKKCSIAARPTSSNQTQSVTVSLQGQKLTSPILVILKGASVSVKMNEEGRLVLEELGQTPPASVLTPRYSANASADGRSVVLQQEELTVTVQVLESDCKESVLTVQVRLHSPALDAGARGPGGVLGPYFQSQAETNNVKREIHIAGQTYVDKGSNIHLLCNATGEEHPPDDIDWFLNGQKLITDADSQISIRKFLSLPDKTIVSILEIKNAKMRDQGVYVCRTTDLQIASQRVDVLNDTGSTSTARPATKGKRGRVQGKGKQSEYGSRVSQDCLAAGFPPEASHALTHDLLRNLASF